MNRDNILKIWNNSGRVNSESTILIIFTKNIRRLDVLFHHLLSKSRVVMTVGNVPIYREELRLADNCSQLTLSGSFRIVASRVQFY